MRAASPIALVALVLLPASAVGSRPAAGWRREVPAYTSSCDTTVAPAGSYPWPVAPFHRQHPVRGNFGDPRIIQRSAPLGADLADDVAYQFHNGVDIVAPDGTRVYPVVDGIVRYVAFDFVVVGSPGRRFQYWHIAPVVHVGEHVRASKAVLGRIRPGYGHVHLTEIDHSRPVNPLEPGHLFPYRDSIPPVVDGVTFHADDGPALDPSDVHGLVGLVVEAHDVSSLRVPGSWANMPVAPATISWTVTSPTGVVVAAGAGIDFRNRLPLPRAFWSIYARGTYQNFPVDGGRYLVGTPGRYLFHVGRLDARALQPGMYQLHVSATDVCGNTGTLTAPFDVASDYRGTSAYSRPSPTR